MLHCAKSATGYYEDRKGGGVRGEFLLRGTVTILDFDTNGCLFGVEVLDASKLLPSELLKAAEH